MPFYEYECKNCGHALEAMQKISDAPLKKCPDCGKSQLQRLMSAPVFRLKGGGWYETDFKGDKENQRNLADRPEAEAPKDSSKDAAKDAPKDGAASSTDAKGKDGNGKDAKGGTDAAGAKDKDAAPKEKSADKAPAAAKPAGKSAVRDRTSARSKTAAKRPVRKPAVKARSRR